MTHFYTNKDQASFYKVKPLQKIEEHPFFKLLAKETQAYGGNMATRYINSYKDFIDGANAMKEALRYTKFKSKNSQQFSQLDVDLSGGLRLVGIVVEDDEPYYILMSCQQMAFSVGRLEIINYFADMTLLGDGCNIGSYNAKEFGCGVLEAVKLSGLKTGKNNEPSSVTQMIDGERKNAEALLRIAERFQATISDNPWIRSVTAKVNPEGIGRN